METLLRNLFDFQRFAENPLLSDLIAETVSRYSTGSAALSDEDVAGIAAAGSLHCTAPEAAGMPEPLKQSTGFSAPDEEQR